MIIGKQEDGGHLIMKFQCQDRLKEMQFKVKLIQKKTCLMILSKKDLKKKAIYKDLKMQLSKSKKRFNS